MEKIESRYTLYDCTDFAECIDDGNKFFETISEVQEYVLKSEKLKRETTKYQGVGWYQLLDSETLQIIPIFFKCDLGVKCVYY